MNKDEGIEMDELTQEIEKIGEFIQKIRPYFNKYYWVSYFIFVAGILLSWYAKSPLTAFISWFVFSPDWQDVYRHLKSKFF